MRTIDLTKFTSKEILNQEKKRYKLPRIFHLMIVITLLVEKHWIAGRAKIIFAFFIMLLHFEIKWLSKQSQVELR